MSTDSRDLPVTVPEEVADGVWAFAQQDGSWWINTAGFVVGSDRVTSIDACATEARTRHLLDAISQVTDRPVRALVNTHAHGDHTYGNCLFDQATILAHEHCREDMLADTLLGQPIPIWDHLPDWGHLEKAYPTVTFTDRLRLWVDDQPIELVYAGGPAHTRGDVVAWLPDRGVLFTGDLAFNGGMPMVVAGSVTGALKSVDWLRDFHARVVVPGHGRPGGPEIFDIHERYYRFVLDTATAAKAAGVSPLDAALQTDLGEFGHLLDRERIVLNLYRAYADLDGRQEVDIAAAFRDAIAYNGGRPLRCVA
jgi:cyclase